MDITLVSQLGSTSSATDASRASMAKGAQPVAKLPAVDVGRVLVEKAVAVSTVENADAVLAIQEAELPTVMVVRSELNVDDASRRVFARKVNRETGATVNKYSAEEALRLFAKTRQQLDRLFKADV